MGVSKKRGGVLIMKKFAKVFGLMFCFIFVVSGAFANVDVLPIVGVDTEVVVLDNSEDPQVIDMVYIMTNTKGALGNKFRENLTKETELSKDVKLTFPKKFAGELKFKANLMKPFETLQECKKHEKSQRNCAVDVVIPLTVKAENNEKDFLLFKLNRRSNEYDVVPFTKSEMIDGVFNGEIEIKDNGLYDKDLRSLKMNIKYIVVGVQE